jgi:hypothetical protein
MAAYEHYMKAADLWKITCHDPLACGTQSHWKAVPLLITMVAEAGGFNIDEYLDTSFQLPDKMMACAVLVPSGGKTNKQTMPRVVSALCDNTLNVLNCHQKLSCFQVELLLKLAWYSAEVEDMHVRCPLSVRTNR